MSFTIQASSRSAPRPLGEAGMVGRTRQLVGVLMLITFIAVLSSMTVINALPQIISDLRGSQNEFTLVISTALVTSVASTPIWGKLADIRNKKVLLQASIGVFAGGSALCGLTGCIPLLIAFRAGQGIGLGGIQALIQVVIAAVIPPRERGRYFGYAAAAQALATIGGPLAGGLIVDSPLGWRWVFYICVPFAVLALFLVQVWLKLPDERRSVRIDYLGSACVSCSVGLLLGWLTMAGNSFPWISWTSGAFAIAAVGAVATTIYVESRAPEPIIPLQLAAQRTIALLTVASVALGICGFSLTAFSVQYLIVGRSHVATAAGVLTAPGMACILISTAVSGNLIARYGRWQRVLLLGSALNLAAFVMLSFIGHGTPLGFVVAGLMIESLGFGMMVQTLVLGAQNAVSFENVGAVTGIVSSVRLLGGALGLSVVGALIDARTAALVSSRLRAAGGHLSWSRGDLDFAGMPPALAGVVRRAYAESTNAGMRACAVAALVGLVAVAFIRETPLRTSVAAAAERGESDQPAGPHEAPSAALPGPQTAPPAPQATGGVVSDGDSYRYQTSIMPKRDQA